MPMKSNENGKQARDDLRAAIFNIDDIDSEIVAVPEWGGKEFEVRAMTGKDRNFVMNAAIVTEPAKDGKEASRRLDLLKAQPEIIIMSCFLPGSGKPGVKVFDLADRDQLAERNSKALDRLSQVATRLAGLTADSVEEAKKNSENTQKSASTTTSAKS
jgi:hypothetical protein